MNRVVDASVLVAALTSRDAVGAWAETILADGVVVAPELALVEATNVIRRLESSDQLGSFEARLAVRDLVRLDLELLPFAPFADRVWELRRNVTSYDAWYVAAAEALALPFATLDRRLARAAGPRCEFLLPPPS